MRQSSKRGAALVFFLGAGLLACGQVPPPDTLAVPAETPDPLQLAALQPNPCAVEGQWVNDRGSAVIFECAVTGGAGRLSGHYNTNVGAPDKGQRFPLTGWVNEDNVSFTVSFKGYGSITAWVGQIEVVNGHSQLKTLWHLSRNIPDENEADDMWQSVTAGASVFTRPAATP